MRSMARMTAGNAVAVALAAACLFVSCSSDSTGPVAGGGSDTEVCGVIVYPGGAPAAGVQVALVPADHDPVLSPALDMAATTDSAGAYVLRDVPAGVYNLEAIVAGGDMSVFVEAIGAGDTAWPARSDTLRPLGIVEVPVPARPPVRDAYVYVRGSSLWAPASAAGMQGQPVRLAAHAGRLPPVVYASSTGTEPPVSLSHETVVYPLALTALRPAETWPCSARVVIDAGPEGAALSEAVTDFPLLVRLDQTVFDFSEAGAGGSDLRFTRGRRYLSYEIERWDSAAGQADIWVKVDTIAPGADTQYVTMHWGNRPVASWECSELVFPRERGHAGVWHLNDMERLTDATSYRNTGTTTGARRRNGVAGNAASLGGTAAITIPAAVFGVVADQISLSVWLFGVPELQPSDGFVFLGKNSANQRVLAAMAPWGDGRIYWEAGRNHSLDSISREADSAGQYEGQWNHWVFTKDCATGDMRIYCNGALWHRESGRFGLIDGITAFALGDCFGEGHHYGGSIDEFRVSAVVLDESWIKLCYETQKPGQQAVRLVR